MKRHQGNQNVPALRVASLIALTSFIFSFAGSTLIAAPPDNHTARETIAALRHSGPVPDIPTPNQRVTVSLPNTTLDNSVPIQTVVSLPVVTTNIEPGRRYVGFQGDFTFDPSIMTFSPPFVEAAALTAHDWSVLANILPGPGSTKVLRVSAYSATLTPLSGTGPLFNLRMVRVAVSPGATTALTWRLYPNAFEFIDDLLFEIVPNQPDGRITITGTGPTATPTPVPVPTPCMPLTEGFDDIFTLVQNYWVFKNNSQPLGGTIWFQGDSTVFPQQSGGTNSYIAANFLNGDGVATISNWLLTPPLELHDGARLTFYTRTVAVRARPDRLQVRMSTNGSSPDVGNTATSVGDFTTLLLDINPDYSTTDYPNLWTQYTAVVSGLGSRVIGRFGFRYFVENAGPGGANSNMIGIDTLRYSSCDEPTPTPVPVTPTPTPGQVCPPTITQSTNQDIVQGNSVACIGLPPDHFHFDNSYWRAFNMNPITGGLAYYVNSVSFGVEVARSNPDVGAQPIILRLHRQTDGEFPGGHREQLAETTANVPDQVGTVVEAPLVAVIPAGTTQLIMELFTPSGQAPASNSFFVGSNPNGQSGPSYLSTQTCEYPDPTDLSLLGFPQMDLVFNINGSCTAPPPTPSPTPSPVPITHALNLSTRLRVGTDDDVGIAGLIVTGNGPAKLLFRGLGPSLGGPATLLSDPVLELHGAGVPIINNNWRDTQALPIVATGLAPPNDLESAILATLDPGSYTAVLRGNNNGVGSGLLDIYDLGQDGEARLANISTRGLVGTGGDILIAGFILGGGTNDDVVLLRGLGPSLAQSGVTNPLANPTLELRNSDGTMIASNDDWQNGPPVSLPPNDPLESAIERTLAPGAYTALLSGVNGGTGLGSIEVYDRGQQ